MQASCKSQKKTSTIMQSIRDQVLCFAGDASRPVGIFLQDRAGLKSRMNAEVLKWRNFIVASVHGAVEV